MSVLVKRDKRGNVNLSIDSPHRGVLLRADTPGEPGNRNSKHFAFLLGSNIYDIIFSQSA